MIVVKIGGTHGIDSSAICGDIATYAHEHSDVVVVHGGSEETNLLSDQLGKPQRVITSPSGFTSRYTDRETLEIFMMAVNGKVNGLIVEELQKAGVNAFGLSGMDGQLLTATRKSSVQSVENGRRKIIHDDFTGKIEGVKTNLLYLLLEKGFLPVVAPLAISSQGEALNVDADRAAAMIAAALHAESLILLTGAPGLLRKFPDESTLIASLQASQLDEASSFAQGRMKKKVLAAQEAIQGGVSKVIISDGRIPSPLTEAIRGKGTHVS